MCHLTQFVSAQFAKRRVACIGYSNIQYDRFNWKYGNVK